jgi:PilZ domain-containing protein
MDPAPDPNGRLETRSNIFVMAALYAAGGSTPVRVRNMSRAGALIEGSALPPAGTGVRLCRGSVSAAGQVVWVDQRKAGLRFVSPTAPADWLPGGQRGMGQQLADEIAHRARLGALPNRVAADDPAAAPDVREELNRLQQLLHRAGEELASDERVAAAHMMTLQAVDAVAQRLAQLAGDIERQRSA